MVSKLVSRKNWLGMSVMALCAITVSGCSGTEHAELSPGFKSLPPDVQKERLAKILKLKGTSGSQSDVDRIIKTNTGK